jgi:hypothetical protein
MRIRFWIQVPVFDSKQKNKLFLIRNSNLLILLGLHKGRPPCKRSLETSKEKHPALQNMKFPLLWVIFALLNPPPADQNQWQIHADPEHWMDTG